ncbi:MAG: hypothetical protein KY434_08575 [Actinobacteria bacterium]|nr:hypothetical protein [Actinomycetota bacterium]
MSEPTRGEASAAADTPDAGTSARGPAPATADRSDRDDASDQTEAGRERAEGKDGSGGADPAARFERPELGPGEMPKTPYQSRGDRPFLAPFVPPTDLLGVGSSGRARVPSDRYGLAGDQPQRDEGGPQSHGQGGEGRESNVDRPGQGEAPDQDRGQRADTGEQGDQQAGNRSERPTLESGSQAERPTGDGAASTDRPSLDATVRADDPRQAVSEQQRTDVERWARGASDDDLWAARDEAVDALTRSSDPAAEHLVGAVERVLNARMEARSLQDMDRDMNGRQAVDDLLQRDVEGGRPISELRDVERQLDHLAGNTFEKALARWFGDRVDAWEGRVEQSVRVNASALSDQVLNQRIGELRGRIEAEAGSPGEERPELGEAAGDQPVTEQDRQRLDAYESERFQRERAAVKEWAKDMSTDQLTREVQTLADKAEFGVASEAELRELSHAADVLDARQVAEITEWLDSLPDEQLDATVQELDQRLKAGEATPMDAKKAYWAKVETEMRATAEEAYAGELQITEGGRVGTREQLAKEAYRAYVQSGMQALTGLFPGAVVMAATDNPGLANAVGEAFGAFGGVAQGRSNFRAANANARAPLRDVPAHRSGRFGGQGTGRGSGGGAWERSPRPEPFTADRGGGGRGTGTAGGGGRGSGGGGGGRGGAGGGGRGRGGGRREAGREPVGPGDARWGGRPTERQPFDPAAAGVRESKGATTRGPEFQSASAQTARSMKTSIRADTGEMHAYRAALGRGEIGLERPMGTNNPGRGDFVTAVERGGTVGVVVTDVKSSTVGRFPSPGTSMKDTWRQQAVEAVAPGRLDLGNPALEGRIREAVAQGRVELRQLNVDYSKTDVPVTDANRRQRW